MKLFRATASDSKELRSCYRNLPKSAASAHSHHAKACSEVVPDMCHPLSTDSSAVTAPSLCVPEQLVHTIGGSSCAQTCDADAASVALE